MTIIANMYGAKKMFKIALLLPILAEYSTMDLVATKKSRT
jgi:hypothetical protein